MSCPHRDGPATGEAPGGEARARAKMVSRRLASKTHIFIALYQFVYIYTPLHDWRYGLASVQWLTFPLLLASGSWLLFGRRLFGPARARQAKRGGRSEAPAR
jgi:hypothetical protein